MRSRLLILALLLAATTIPLCANATCTYVSGDGPVTMSYRLPTSMTVPANTPNGIIIYKGGSGVPQKLNNKFNCTTEFSVGTMDARGQNAISGTYPIGDTGLAWEWTYNNEKVRQYPAFTLPAGINWYFDKTIQGFNIVKVGDIKAGAKIPAGILGYYRDGELYPIALNVTEMNIVAASCQSPENITVDLGKPSASDFKYEKYNKSSPFGIQITNCPKGISNIAISLIPTTSSPAISPSNGLISLNPSSTAKGVAIQIKNQDNSIFDLSKKYVVATYEPGSASARVELQAQLYPLSQGAKVTPGTVKAEIMYLLEYL